MRVRSRFAFTLLCSGLCPTSLAQAAPGNAPVRVYRCVAIIIRREVKG